MDVRGRVSTPLRLGIRGHEVVVDQPVADGGTDAGPTPTELFVGGLVPASRSTRVGSWNDTGSSAMGYPSPAIGRWPRSGRTAWGVSRSGSE